MRAGFVGIFTNYRAQEFKGAKYGVIDVIFNGDLTYPTETQEIKVFDSKICAFLIKTRSMYFNPVITFCGWLDLKSKEPSIHLLEVISIDNPNEFNVIQEVDREDD